MIHSKHSVDGYPICMPVDYWIYNKINFEVTSQDDKVTCKKCKAVLEQMYAEIGRPE